MDEGKKTERRGGEGKPGGRKTLKRAARQRTGRIAEMNPRLDDVSEAKGGEDGTNDGGSADLRTAK